MSLRDHNGKEKSMYEACNLAMRVKVIVSTTKYEDPFAVAGP